MDEELFKAAVVLYRERARERFSKEQSLARLWYFPSLSKPLPTNAIDKNPFLVPKTTFRIVDFFGDRMPIAFDRQSVDENVTMLSCYRTILLDSNLYNYMHWFVCGEPGKERERVEFSRLLEMLTSWRCDYNSLPYIFEQAAKNTAKEADSYTLHIMRDTFLLHNMNEALFSSSGEFHLDNHKLMAQFGTTEVDFDRHTQDVFTSLKLPRDQHAMVTLYHILLLQCVKVRRSAASKNLSSADQVRILMDFLTHDVGFSNGRIMTVALLFFAGALDKFIPWQPERNPEKAAKQIAGSAWDLFIISMPEIVLAHGARGLYEAPLALFCTADEECARIAARFRIAEVAINHGGSPLPLVESDLQGIDQMYGADFPVLQRDMSLAQANMRMLRASGRVRPVKRQRLPHLLRDLRRETGL